MMRGSGHLFHVVESNWVLLLLATLAVSCTYEAKPAPGGLKCASGVRACPDGFVCHSTTGAKGCERTCWKVNDPPTEVCASDASVSTDEKGDAAGGNADGQGS